jgi:hypothetical protein
MTTAQVLADRFRKMAEGIRRVVPEQDLKVLARELDLVLPAHAGQLMCGALDSGFFQPEAVWDLRKYSPKYVPSDGETVETVFTRLQREYVAQCSQFSDARERGLWELKIEAIQESTQPSAQRKNLFHQIAYAASWWAFFRELWRSEPLQFRPDADRHFLFLEVFLTLNRGDEFSERESFYSLHEEKPTRVRHRLIGSADLQAAACEVVAAQLVNLPPPPSGNDVADENGMVANPAVPSCYVSMTDILNEHTPSERKLTAGRLRRICNDYPQFKVRWTRPLGMDGKPRKNCRCIHLLDWEHYLQSTSNENADGTDFVGPNEKGKRQAAIRMAKAISR